MGGNLGGNLFAITVCNRGDNSEVGGKMNKLLFLGSGVLCWILGMFTENRLNPPPLLTETPSGYRLEHIPYPDCPNTSHMIVDIPEEDEVSALTVVCTKTIPNTDLGVDSKGKVE